MAEVNISFKKNTFKKTPQIPGSKSSAGNFETYVSSGIPSLDPIIGGGYVVGNVILIEEDEGGIFTDFFMKYFIAEGIVCGHNGFFASLDIDTKRFIKQLPSPAVIPDINEVVNNDPKEAKNDLKIAWRYHDKPVVQSTPTATFGHSFDLTKLMSQDYIQTTELFHWKRPDEDSGSSIYENLINVLENRLNIGGYLPIKGKPLRRTLLRIVIHSAGSPLWGSPLELPKFFYKLRLLVQNSLSVCVVTVPTYMIQEMIDYASDKNCDVNIIARCKHLSNCSFKLESLIHSKENAYRTYDGRLIITKLSTTNKLTPFTPNTVDWGFKIRKTKLIIEKLHLPPELDDTQREQNDTATLGCGKKNLDF